MRGRYGPRPCGSTRSVVRRSRDWTVPRRPGWRSRVRGCSAAADWRPGSSAGVWIPPQAAASRSASAAASMIVPRGHRLASNSDGGLGGGVGGGQQRPDLLELLCRGSTFRRHRGPSAPWPRARDRCQPSVDRGADRRPDAATTCGHRTGSRRAVPAISMPRCPDRRRACGGLKRQIDCGADVSLRGSQPAPR